MAPDSQLPFDLDPKPSLTRDDLIVTDANRAAVALVDGWPHWPAPCVAIVGPAGSGKTHLATVWQAMTHAHRLRDRLRPDEADQRAAQAGHAILCDGLQCDGLDEAAFFHLLNAVRGAGGTMLITTTTNPAHWALQTPDLTSRFRAVTIAVLELPDDDLLRAVAAKLFADRQVTVDPSIIDYLLPRVERSLPALADLVDRLDATALARKSAITRPLAAEVLRASQPGGMGA